MKLTMNIPLLCAAMMLSLTITFAAPPDDHKISFGENLDAALGQAGKDGRLVVMYFSSPRCSWCRKLEIVSFSDARVLALAKRFVWVKVPQASIDMLAGFNKVAALPYLLVVNSKGIVVARQGGYLPPEKLSEFLRQAMEAPLGDRAARLRQLADQLADSIGTQGSNGTVPAALEAIVDTLAAPDRAGRAELLGAIEKAGHNVRQALCTLMDSKFLAKRAAAGDTLAYVTGGTLPFDPFAEQAVRIQQVRAWREWLIKNPDAKRPEPAIQPAKEPVNAQPGQPETNAPTTTPASAPASDKPSPAASPKPKPAPTQEVHQ